jgi:hypothetical protein
VFSTYEGRSESGATVVREINSMQLVNDGTRWWTADVFWEAEDDPLPAEYVG